MPDSIESQSAADSPVNEPQDGPSFEPYESPAGGWGALQATAKALREQSVALKGSKALPSMNQPDGFDCPGCAWPDPRHTSSFESCENGAKAVAFELTKRRVTREFFAAHTVRDLEQKTDYWLEEQGRLTEPMRYYSDTDHFVPVSWEEAFALIGRELRALADPNEAEFYTSGRTSNEAAFKPIADAAMRRLRLTVGITTKLNRGHLVHGEQALILPCLARSDIDVQSAGRQSVTVEDSMSMVHASTGLVEPPSRE